MNIYEKIMAIYPQVTEKDFGPKGSILLQNDSDGRGDYIAVWEHPTLPKPTNDQLQGLNYGAD